MKRFLILFCIVLSTTACFAETIDYGDFSTSVTMANFWEKNGKYEEKVITVGQRVINANKLEKRIPIMVKRDMKYINAYAMLNPKVVVVSSGLLPYLDNDDELAFIMGHEMAHSLDAYDGPGKWVAMKFNSKSYEYKADLIGIDLMSKAGYNPIAAITGLNKFAPEPMFDFGIFTSHPKTSKRALEMYKYIYKKYPWALESDMTKNLSYQNFVNYSQKEINKFIQEEKEREDKRKSKYSI